MNFVTLKDKAYWSKYFKLAWPMTLQFLLSNSLGFIDVFLISHLGEDSLSALQVANQYALLVIIINFGVASGAGVFAAQYWGSKDVIGMARIQGLAMMLALTLSMVPMFFGIFARDAVAAFYTPLENIVSLGGLYIGISAIGFPMIAISMSVSTVLRSMEKVKLPLFISILTVIINIFLNIVLINGYLGFPKLGLEGSAWGTVIARIFEAAGLIVFSLILRYPNFGQPIRVWFAISRAKFAQYMRTALPVIGNEFGWAAGTSVISAIMSRSGPHAQAALTISDTIAQFMQIFLFSSINATAVIIGNTAGEGRLRRTFVMSRRSLTTAFLIGVLGVIILIGLAQFLPNLFALSEKTRELAVNFIYILAFVMIIRSLLYHLTVGVFRGGGSTIRAFILEVGGMWLISIPIGYAISIMLKLGSEWSYFAILASDIIVLIFAYILWARAKWMKKVV